MKRFRKESSASDMMFETSRASSSFALQLHIHFPFAVFEPGEGDVEFPADIRDRALGWDICAGAYSRDMSLCQVNALGKFGLRQTLIFD